jgi:hypothetical protein
MEGHFALPAVHVASGGTEGDHHSGTERSPAPLATVRTVKPAAIRLRPSITSWAEHPEDFQALTDGLRERGLEVELVEPGPLNTDYHIQAAGMDLLIDLLGEVKEEVIGAVVAEMIRRVGMARKRRKDRRPVIGVIYGPDGKIIREVLVDHKRDRGPT